MTLRVLLMTPTVVQGPDLPPPAEGLYALAPVMLALLLISILSVRRRRRSPVGGRRRAGFMSRLAGSAVMSTIMLDLGAMLDPSRPDAAVVESAEDDSAPDAVGDFRRPPSPYRRTPPSVPPTNNGSMRGTPPAKNGLDERLDLGSTEGLR